MWWPKMKKIILTILFLSFSSLAHATLPVAVYEVRSSATAGNVNGGGFNSARGGTDYTLQDGAQESKTDGASTASTTFTSATATFTDAMKGNFLHLTAATGTPTVGWYEIVSVTNATTVVLDRVSGTYTLGTFYVGGAMSMASTLDDEFFEIFIAGSTVWVKTGTYTSVEGISVANDATAALPVNIIGYNSARDDNPTGANRPTLAFGASASVFNGQYYSFKNLIITTTTNAGFEVSQGNCLVNVKITNSSGTANAPALGIGGAATGGVFAINCEFVATGGDAVRASDTTCLVGCYIHDSVKGVRISSSTGTMLINNIIESCTTAIDILSASSEHYFFNNTLYGAETPAGTGFNLPTTTVTKTRFIGNIIYGFTTGVNAGTNVGSNFWDYNNFYNNTTDRTNVTAGDNDLAVDPQFTDAAGGDFSIGTNLKAAGFPGAFPGSSTTGYLDVGAVQRTEPATQTDILGDITG